MNSIYFKSLLVLILLGTTSTSTAQDFQGEAHYFSKTTMDMSRFARGRQLSEQQKKQMKERFKSWLEKNYILNFNQEESIFSEVEKLSSPVGGRGHSVWGSSFSPGPQYKNIKDKVFIQDQEFFGKKFLVKEDMKPYQWIMGSETKQIGQYTCFKATTIRLAEEVNWMTVSRGSREQEEKAKKSDSLMSKENEDKPSEIDEPVETVLVTAWYTPQIPVSQGPSEYWGLPGLILELNAGNTTMLCSKIILNPKEKKEIEIPHKGEVVTKNQYHKIIAKKTQEFRDSRRRGDRRRPRN
mgnify:CR=1 FL=1